MLKIRNGSAQFAKQKYNGIMHDSRNAATAREKKMNLAGPWGKIGTG